MSLDRVKFKYPEEALAFLKRLEGSLTRLTLDQAFPKENLDSFEMFSFLKMERLEELSLQKVGVLNLNGIEKCFPNLTYLNLEKNKIFAVEAVEMLHKLPELAEVSFKENPICVHKHLTEMVTDVVPKIEVVNQQPLHEAGHRFRVELEQLKDRVKKMGTDVGSAAADEALAEFDPGYGLDEDGDDTLAGK